jgi:hypothetical protein
MTGWIAVSADAAQWCRSAGRRYHWLHPCGQLVDGEDGVKATRRAA